MRQSTQSIITLLDEGLLVYRRGFTTFAALAAIGIVPVAIGIGSTILLGQYWTNDAIILAVGVWVLIGVLVLIILGSATSRAALSIYQNESVQLGRVLKIHPARMVGMGCFGSVMLAVMNVLSTVFSCICMIPLSMLFTISLGSALGVGSSLTPFADFFGMIIGFLMVLVFILFYGFSLVISGATYCGMVYAIQPFALEQLPIFISIQRGINMLFNHLGRNIMAFLGTSLVFGSLAVVVTIGVGVLVPLPVIFALGESSPIAQAIGATAWLIGFALVLPLMPIWMALLYHQNRNTSDGVDLADRIAHLNADPPPQIV